MEGGASHETGKFSMIFAAFCIAIIILCGTLLDAVVLSNDSSFVVQVLGCAIIDVIFLGIIIFVLIAASLPSDSR